MLYHRALGQLQHQAPRLDPRVGQDLPDLFGEGGLLELWAGEVHRDEELPRDRLVVLPLLHLTTGLVEDPLAQGDDQPGPFGNRDELERRDHAAGGVLPPHEGLESRDPARRQGHDRFIGDRELLASHRFPEVRFQLQPALGRLQDRGVEDLAARLAE